VTGVSVPRAAPHAYGVYIHIPYCPAICPYCDFNVAVRKQPPWREFAKAVTDQLAVERFAGDVRTLYFGGGTPSLAPPQIIAELVQAVGGHPSEVTLEGNPGTVTGASLKGFRDAGITRVSLGWQSTHDRLLKTLGRTHSAAESRDAAIAVKAAGFAAMSIDLIFAVPGQSMRDLDEDIDAVFAIDPEHVSLYGLTYHQGTPFERAREKGTLMPVDEQTESAMFERIAERLSERGYRHYEVSNFAKPGFEAQHNSSYWHGIPYLGLGPGAHSFSGSARWENLRNPDRYIASPLQKTFREELSALDVLRERILTGLRLDEGINLAIAPFNQLALGVDEAVRQGLAIRDGTWLRPTKKGRLQADTLAEIVAP
jgi:oxygen-independent coproporphyrinogen-3 oxidase